MRAVLSGGSGLRVCACPNAPYGPFHFTSVPYELVFGLPSWSSSPESPFPCSFAPLVPFFTSLDFVPLPPPPEASHRHPTHDGPLPATPP